MIVGAQGGDRPRATTLLSWRVSPETLWEMPAPLPPIKRGRSLPAPLVGPDRDASGHRPVPLLRRLLLRGKDLIEHRRHLVDVLLAEEA